MANQFCRDAPNTYNLNRDEVRVPGISPDNELHHEAHPHQITVPELWLRAIGDILQSPMNHLEYMRAVWIGAELRAGNSGAFNPGMERVVDERLPLGCRCPPTNKQRSCENVRRVE